MAQQRGRSLNVKHRSLIGSIQGRSREVLRFFERKRYKLTPEQTATVDRLMLAALSRRAAYWLIILLVASAGGLGLATRHQTVAANAWLPLDAWAFGVWLFTVPYLYLLYRTIRDHDRGERKSRRGLDWLWILWCSALSFWWMIGAFSLTQPKVEPGTFTLDLTTFMWTTLLGHVFTVLALAPSWKAVWGSVGVAVWLPLLYLGFDPPSGVDGHLVTTLQYWLGGQAAAWCLVGLFLHQDIRRGYARGLLIEHERLQVERERQLVEKASSEKNFFIASISHDVRQPLTALSLALTSLSGKVRTHPLALIDVVDAQAQARSIEDMVDGAFDVARLEAGTWKVSRREIALPRLVVDVVERVRAEARAKNLSIGTFCPPYLVRSDYHALQRILHNLLHNAIRYTPARDAPRENKNSILVGCQRRGQMVRISVIDTGIGIPEERLDDIFKEYVQLDNVERDRYKGFGLGLAIVRGLAKLLEHEPDVRSRVGAGSRFSISVPIVGRIPPELLDSTGSAGSVETELQLNVALLEDDPDVRRRMVAHLSELGCYVFAGESADQLLARLATEEPPCELQFILSDYRLRDGRTGVEEIRSIRKNLGRPVPAAICAAQTSAEVLRKVADEGFELLPKPIPQARLLSLLKRYELRSTEESATATTLGSDQVPLQH